MKLLNLVKMIVKNRLLNFNDMIIYQDDDYFLFSLDSVLLANFVNVKLTDKKIIDFCSGNAPVPMLLSNRTKARLFGVELQKNIYELGLRSIKENDLGDKIEFLNLNIKDIDKQFDEEYFDIITCNPPYFKYSKGSSIINDNLGKSIARHEIEITLEEIIKISKKMLKNGGTLAMVHKPERLIEIINVMQKYGIEPKRIRMVYPKKGKEANIILVEGIKNGRSGLKIEPPLVVYDEKGKYSTEIAKMFGGE